MLLGSLLRDALKTAHLENDLEDLIPRKRSELFPAFKYGGHVTLLAPTNDAFARLGPTFHRLLSNVKQLRQVSI